HTSARPWVITGRAISTTAFFWAWAHGAVGAIATVGADIASAVKVAGDTTADLAAPPTAKAVAAAVLAAADNLYMAEGRGPAQVVQKLRTVMAVDKPTAVEAARVMAVVVVVVDRATAVAVGDRATAAGG